MPQQRNDAWPTVAVARGHCTPGRGFTSDATLSAKGYVWFWPKISTAQLQSITGWLLRVTVAAPRLI